MNTGCCAEQGAPQGPRNISRQGERAPLLLSGGKEAGSHNRGVTNQSQVALTGDRGAWEGAVAEEGDSDLAVGRRSSSRLG